jgi:dihydrodipicolinate synthase/N-acetylneuraminate lyase
VTGTVAASVPPGTPVIAGMFAHNHEQAVAEIAAYADRGATAVLAAPPAYYPLTPAEQQGYFGRLADATALPLVIYNIPVFTKIIIDPAVAAALAAHPRVAGLKDSGRDLDYAAGLLGADRDGLDDRELPAGRGARHHLREREHRARGRARCLRRGPGGQAR